VHILVSFIQRGEPMSVADSSMGEVPIAAQRGGSATKSTPRNRTTTAKSDVVAQPEPR
jgi:hypothetical protein